MVFCEFFDFVSLFPKSLGNFCSVTDGWIFAHTKENDWLINELDCFESHFPICDLDLAPFIIPVAPRLDVGVSRPQFGSQVVSSPGWISGVGGVPDIENESSQLR